MLYETNLAVRYAETGIEGRLKPGMILNYFQDIASDHCAELGVSALDLLPKNLAWVVYRYHLNIYRYPLWKEDLQFKTWRYPANNLYELRQFDVHDKAENLIITAKSAWILTRLDNKKPVRLKYHMPEQLMNGHQQPVENDFTPIPERTEKDDGRSFLVRMHDLDFNRHVNNAVYVIWALESVPADIAASRLPYEISIQYQGDAVFGDRITAFTQPFPEKPESEAAYLHTIHHDGEDKPITRVITRWHPFDAFSQTP
ncbi:MAG: hypothetical protein KGY61_00855 [Desulfobacterales bacterium]|nr:hypothetical protein [Desulfobacterales bacterium]